MKEITNAIGLILGFIGLIIIIGMILALPTMWLWDWIMPKYFGLREITWLDAWGVNILSGILFKSTNSSKNK